jgi:anthranilate phosphoribosyltransferase
MKDLIRKVQSGDNLSREESYAAMSALLDSNATYVQRYDFLVAMNAKDVTVDELVGFSQGITAKAITISPKVDTLIDTCGTGGDGKGTMNVSTGVAFVLSTIGIPVAKHGNYAISSKSGSADVLKALGYNVHLAPDACKRMIEEEQFGFLLAPNFHPAMKTIAPVRKEVGRTIFNLLGPLCNPAPVTAQVIGVYDERLCEPFCHALKDLGLRRALVVHGSGLDELSTIDETLIYELNNGEISYRRIKPEDFGLQRCRLEDVSGSSPEENARHLKGVFAGEKGPRMDIIVLNAAAGIYVSDRVASLEDGIKQAQEALYNQAVSKKAARIIERSNK